MMLIGARAHFCAGHSLPQHPTPHGHSYEVWAYATEGMDAEELQRAVQAACATLDHRMLNDFMPEPTMENIARHIAKLMPGAARVRVVRPVEGLCAEYTIP